eukprot:jgi/Chlat1/263/Chrsp1S03158
MVVVRAVVVEGVVAGDHRVVVRVVDLVASAVSWLVRGDGGSSVHRVWCQREQRPETAPLCRRQEGWAGNGNMGPLAPWSEAEQQAVRRFWEGLSLPPQQVATLLAKRMSLSLYPSPKELERRLHEMRKLLPGVTTAAVARPALLPRNPELLARSLSRLKTLLSISDTDLCTMLRRAPTMLKYMADAVAE